ncbi:MAG: hypothetical protein HY200_10120 [Nitrospirae bacterium]|nr:hypothetical protein [Nitrospirota bacterium]MBI3595301.1 hypothetical protein [Nitrospirota bacterium]
MNLDRKRLAYHEAGHAVLSHHFNQIALKITIEPEGNFLGFHQGKSLEDFPDLNAIEDPDEYEKWTKLYEEEILICLAGPEAEGLFTGEFDLTAQGEDYDKASSLALRLGLDNYDSYLDQLGDWLESGNIKRNIKIIARGLLDKNTLTGEEIDKLLGSKK